MRTTIRRCLNLVATLLLGAMLAAPPPAGAADQAQVQVYGVWHCSNDACLWGTARTVAQFRAANGWIFDRGDGRPSVNLVVLSFVNPLKLLNRTTGTGTFDGVPRGMTQEIVDELKAAGIRVMVSIGGITYTKDWNTALAQDAAGLGRKAAALATDLGVGIEIDYEENRSPNLPGLEAFITAYRSIHPYDPTGADHRARLTIDVGAGDRWLIGINRKATAEWLLPGGRVLDYANAMVPAKQPGTASAIANWQEHVDGKPRYDPPIPPLAPARFTGSVYIAEGSQVRPECNDFGRSLLASTGSFVRTVAPNGAGVTSGMLGWMGWAAEKPSTRGVGTAPPNTCEGGIGVGASTYDIPIPMPALRQQ